jgi:hypothetical protein
VQRADQLIQEQRDSVIDLPVGWRGVRPRGHLGFATADELIAVYGNEFMKHVAQNSNIAGQEGFSNKRASPTVKTCRAAIACVIVHTA